jgi:ketosteroid isomerase-like protein
MVERYVEAFEQGDVNIIRGMYADDAVVEDPVGTEPHRGIEAICTFYSGAIGAGAQHGDSCETHSARFLSPQSGGGALPKPRAVLVME